MSYFFLKILKLHQAELVLVLFVLCKQEARFFSLNLWVDARDNRGISFFSPWLRCTAQMQKYILSTFSFLKLPGKTMAFGLDRVLTFLYLTLERNALTFVDTEEGRNGPGAWGTVPSRERQVLTTSLFPSP